MYTIRMRQRYDNVAKFVTTEYAEPFKELLRAVPKTPSLEAFTDTLRE